MPEHYYTLGQSRPILFEGEPDFIRFEAQKRDIMMRLEAKLLDLEVADAIGSIKRAAQ